MKESTQIQPSAASHPAIRAERRFVYSSVCFSMNWRWRSINSPRRSYSWLSIIQLSHNYPLCLYTTILSILFQYIIMCLLMCFATSLC